VSESPIRRVEKPSMEPKKAYTPPTLVEYGNVAKLTMAKGSTSFESGPNMMAG
jgi:hypothetical protein